MIWFIIESAQHLSDFKLTLNFIGDKALRGVFQVSDLPWASKRGRKIKFWAPKSWETLPFQNPATLLNFEAKNQVGYKQWANCLILQNKRFIVLLTNVKETRFIWLLNENLTLKIFFFLILSIIYDHEISNKPILKQILTINIFDAKKKVNLYTMFSVEISLVKC